MLETPDLIRQVHLDYFRAGADCAITASYQATIEGFVRRGLSLERAIDLIQLSVRLAITARDEFWSNSTNRAGRPRPFVAASVGPYGAFLADGSEYRGDYGLTEQQLIDFHRPRLAALVAAGPDMLACETIPCLVEAQALARLLAEFPGITAWFSFSARDAIHISHGERLAGCVALLDGQPQITAIGVNCTAPAYIPDLIRAAGSATNKPILVYPNSGEIYDADTNCWHGVSEAEAFGGQARHWYACGARLIGGCCRTTPDHIGEVAAWVRSHKT
ncbi:MAG: homocysteine S-methyltransferase [Gemmataceae bacterium]|nr:homocysteine S-methyltransferase [Gemmataceae bacterium]